MAGTDGKQREARERAQRFVASIVSDRAVLAEVQADEIAVLNGHCPPADADDAIERRLRDLDA
jgi:hypothetical protein